MCQITAYHQLNDLICCQVFRFFCCDPLTVTHDSNFIGNAENFFHLMADVNHCYAFVAQLIDNIKKMLNLFLCQRGCRFVQHQNFRIVRYGFRDFYHLTLGNAQFADNCFGIYRDIKVIKNLLCFIVHLLMADQALIFRESA